MFDYGVEHKLTRALSNNADMKSTPFVEKCAKNCVDYINDYDQIMEWVQRSFIDLFFSIMIGSYPNVIHPKSTHPLKDLPKDDEKAFLWGLYLSVFPKFLTTEMEKGFKKAIDNMTDLGIEELDKFLELPKDQQPDSFMKDLVQNKGGTKTDCRELMALFITAFQGNIALTMQNVIFHLATNIEIQDKLYEEILSMKGLYNIMDEYMPYLEAIHKESHRISPITAYTQIRAYNEDLILPSGYTVPRNTILMYFNQLSARDERFVDEPKKFKPERYYRKTLMDPDKNLHAFVQSSEFGSNGRSCLGRRSAKAMLRCLIVEIVKRYKFKADPYTTEFTLDPLDSSFNRIKPFPKIILEAR